MKISNVKKSVWLAASLAASLAACGGSAGSGPTQVVSAEPAPTAEVPATASLSVVGYISYINNLVAAAADALESVDLSKTTAPSDDSSEPSPVF